MRVQPAAGGDARRAGVTKLPIGGEVFLHDRVSFALPVRDRGDGAQRALHALQSPAQIDGGGRAGG